MVQNKPCNNAVKQIKKILTEQTVDSEGPKSNIDSIHQRKGDQLAYWTSILM